MSSSPPEPKSSDQQSLPIETAESKTPFSISAPDVQRTMSDFDKEPVKETEWVSGLALWILMLPLCCTFFLILLDISIIATVGNARTTSLKPSLTTTPGSTSNHQ